MAAKEEKKIKLIDIPLSVGDDKMLAYFLEILQHIFVEKEMIKTLFFFFTESQFFKFYEFLMSQSTFANFKAFPKDFQWIPTQPLIKHIHEQRYGQVLDLSGRSMTVPMCYERTSKNSMTTYKECDLFDIEKFGWVEFIKKRMKNINQDVKQKEKQIIAFLYGLKKIFKEE